MIPLLALALAAAPPAVPPVEIAIRRANDGCIVGIEGSVYRMPRESRHIGRHLARLKACGRTATIVGDMTTPYRCIGGIIFDAQRRQLRICFIAEPPPGR
jgi:hypothetical protein